MKKMLSVIIVLGSISASAEDLHKCGRNEDKFFSNLVQGNREQAISIAQKRNFNPNCYTNSMQTPLFYAVASNSDELVEILLRKGADANSRNSGFTNGNQPWGDNVTPLFLAKSPKIAQLLFQYGAKINIQDSFGNSPLHFSSGYSSIPALREKLRSEHESLFFKNKDGCLPIHSMVDSPNTLKVYLDALSQDELSAQLASKCLIMDDVFTSPNYKQKFPKDLFELASITRNIETVKILIPMGLSYDQAISVGIRNRDLNFLKDLLSDDSVHASSFHLLEIGVDYDAYKLIIEKVSKPQQGHLDSALINLMAHSYWNFEKSIPMAKSLLDLGANPNKQDQYAQTAISIGYFWCGQTSNPYQKCDLVEFVEEYTAKNVKRYDHLNP